MTTQNIGEFELFLDKMIGKGAWGEVYHGRQKSLNRPVAIKILKKQLTADEEFVKRFRRESETLAKMVDEHIIQVYSAGEHEGSYYFIMEYVQGQPLSKFIEHSHKFSINEIVYVAESVTRALKTAWESPAKIVHRDIKPSNIMVSYTSSLITPHLQQGVSESMAAIDVNILEAKIKVMDFGLAKVSEGGKEATMVGTVIGTPKYISPEQGLGNPADIRSDIYSLGIVMYELATGRIPFESETAVSMIRHHIYDTATAPSEFNPEIPQDLENIIMRCIQKEPEKRYANPNQLIEDLTAFRQQQTPVYATSTTVEATMISDVRRGKTRRLKITAALITIVVVGIALALYLKPWEDQKTGSVIPTPGVGTQPVTQEPAIKEPNPTKTQINVQIDKLINQYNVYIQEGKLEEAKGVLEEALEKDPDAVKPKQLMDKINREIELQERNRLADALMDDEPSPIEPAKIPDQKTFNYILTRRAKRKFSEAKKETEKLIDRNDEIISPAAIYFQIKLLAEEENDNYLESMKEYLDKLENFYPGHKAIARTKELLSMAQAAREKEIYQACLTSVDRTDKLREKIKILNNFIRANPKNRHRSEAEKLITQIQNQIKEVHQKAYQALLAQIKQSRAKHLYKKALSTLSKAQKDYPEKSEEIDSLTRDTENDYFKHLGIIPTGNQRDQVTKLPMNVRSIKDNVEMILVPAGEFTMGSETGAPDERPRHMVYLDVYYIDKYEITNARFKKFVDATGYKTEAEKTGGGWVWSESRWVRGASWQDPKGDGRGPAGDHPVVQISGQDAQAYAQWAGKRLPTEAEWEKSARGLDGNDYPWGNNWDAKRCNSREDGPDKTTSVGKYKNGISNYRCADLSGNVAEWCADWYQKDYYRNSPKNNPTGPPRGLYHVFRGGSWVDNQKNVQSAARSEGYIEGQPGCWSDAIGFRCVKDVKE